MGAVEPTNAYGETSCANAGEIAKFLHHSEDTERSSDLFDDSCWDQVRAVRSRDLPRWVTRLFCRAHAQTRREARDHVLVSVYRAPPPNAPSSLMAFPIFRTHTIYLDRSNLNMAAIDQDFLFRGFAEWLRVSQSYPFPACIRSDQRTV